MRRSELVAVAAESVGSCIDPEGVKKIFNFLTLPSYVCSAKSSREPELSPVWVCVPAVRLDRERGANSPKDPFVFDSARDNFLPAVGIDEPEHYLTPNSIFIDPPFRARRAGGASSTQPPPAFPCAMGYSSYRVADTGSFADVTTMNPSNG